MAEIKKFMFDNFIVGEPKIEIPEETSAVVEEETVIPEDAVSIVSEPEEPEPEIQPEEIFVPLAPEPVVVTYTQDELDAKVAAAGQEAYAKGCNETRASVEAEANVLLNDISTQLKALFAEREAETQKQEQETVAIIREALQTLVPTLLEEQAVALVDKFLRDNFNNFKHNAKLSFYINPDIISYIQDSIVKLANSHDFEGKIAIHKDSGLGRSSCRVEWDNGGVEYSPDRQLAAVSELLNHDTGQENGENK